MRIKFGKRIRFCSTVTLPEGSKLLIITTDNGVYTVDMQTSDNARKVHSEILINGYADMSGYEYSN